MKEVKRMETSIKTLPELTSTEFFEIAQERVKVFVVEQNCPYQEIDEDDSVAKHVILKKDNQIIAYSRIIEKPEHVTFGRVLVVEEFRGDKLGQELVKITLAEIERLALNKPVIISAQNYLVDFYSSFGFEVISDVYLEDDIPHIDMELRK